MRLVFWAALVAFLVDQASKYLVIHLWRLWHVREIDVLPPLLNFRYGENRGINFGLLDTVNQWPMIILALVICAAVAIWARRHQLSRLAQISTGVLIGGALANVADRLIYGYVLDFINNSCCGFDNPFVYNVADIFIFGGAFGLILFAGDAKPRSKAQKKAPNKARKKAG